jgi:hypothetical protein
VALAGHHQAAALRSAQARLPVAVPRWEARAEAPRRRELEVPSALALLHPVLRAVRRPEAAEQRRVPRRVPRQAERRRAMAREDAAEARHRDHRVAPPAAGNRPRRRHLRLGKVANRGRQHEKLRVAGRVVQKREAPGSRLGAEKPRLRVVAGHRAPRRARNRPPGAGVARRARGLAPGARFPYPVRSAQSAVTLK